MELQRVPPLFHFLTLFTAFGVVYRVGVNVQLSDLIGTIPSYFLSVFTTVSELKCHPPFLKS